MYEKIERLIFDGYTFSILKIGSRAWNLVKKNWAVFLGFWIVYALMSFMSNILPIVGLFISYLVIAPAMAAGFAIFADRLIRHEESNFGVFFDGFKFLNQLIPYTLLSYLIASLASIPMIVALINAGAFDFFIKVLSVDAQSIEEIGTDLVVFSTWDYILFLFSFLLIASIGILLWWTPYFIVFHKMGFWPAMQNSVKLVKRNFSLHFQLILLGVGTGIAVSLLFVLLFSALVMAAPIVNILLSLVFFVLLLLWVSWLYLLPFMAFIEVIGTQESEEDENLAGHLID